MGNCWQALITSCSSLKLYTGATGPKVSSEVILAWGVTSVRIVGW